MLDYWQSLNQLAESPEILEKISKEFPGYDPDHILSLSRRRFVQIMGASMALAGLTLSGCRRWPKEELAPYSSNPRDRTPGVPEQYATIYEMCGVGQPLLATSYDGRPIKIDGNPTHPFSQTFNGLLGSADAQAQASVLELYDPQRSRTPIDRTHGQPRQATWEQFWQDMSIKLEDLRTAGGKGLAILSEASFSPSILAMRQRIAQLYPQASWHEYEPISRDNEIEGSKLAFGGKSVRVRLQLDEADAIVCLDADILGAHPAHIRHANDWAKRRRSADERGGMNRMYVAESQRSITGSVADERIGVRPSRVPAIAVALAAKLGVSGASAPADLSPEESRFVESAAKDLKKNGVVVAGAHLPPQIHALVHAINAQIGGPGNTFTLVEEPGVERKSIAQLCDQIKTGGITTLLIIGGNPVYDAPADLDFAAALANVPTSVHLSLFDDETSHQCKWHLPRAHYLESWGDARAWDGTISIQQPLIRPLFGGKSSIEFLAMICGDADPDGHQIVQKTFGGSDEDFRRALNDGLVANSGFATVTAKPQAPAVSVGADGATTQPAGLEIRFIPDQKLFDGRFANNGWLQEIPDSLTKLTWDNAALISTKDADELNLDSGDVITLSVGGRSLQMAAYVLPGQPVGVVGLALGYGRSAAGHIGNGLGFNTYTLRTSQNLDWASGAQITKSGGTYALAATQDHHIIDPVAQGAYDVRVGTKYESGKVVREATLAAYEKDPYAPHRGQGHTVSLQLFEPPSQFNHPHAWGMTIDMNACIGCNACTVACQAENNIPIVGKENVIANREMHWLRIDRYFKGAPEDPNPEVIFQPMMCVHCENAPCEQVCPVGATTHDTEGLNTMVYNRCIGTRYCSNNCPYKVRRFNYFDWQSKDPRGGRFMGPWLGMPDSQQQDEVDKIKRMVFNPEVTVRMRGVMEKCTYCVQRIHNTNIAKRNQNQELEDFDVVTACQQACPTEAIVFGNLNDADAKVTKLQKNPRAYSVLEDLNTRPRSKHLAKLRNPSET